MEDIKYNLIKTIPCKTERCLKSVWDVNGKQYMVSTVDHDWAKETMIFAIVPDSLEVGKCVIDYTDLYCNKDITVSHEECVKDWVTNYYLEETNNNGS